MPSSSSARSRSDSVRGEMPAQERSSSEKRRGPSERSWTRSAVHFAPMISAHAATPQVAESWTGFIVRTAMHELYARCLTKRRRARLDLRNREAGDDAEPRRRLARLGDAGVAGDREEDECILG